MTTLHDRLADLAADAPAGQAEPDLWDRGRRLVRRRRDTQVIAGATAALVAALGIGWWQQSPGPVAPASAEAELRLPDRFYEPGGWLPGTGDSGPIGPLAAVLGAERSSWTGGDYGVVGISGATGDYRFLDLPDDAVTDSTTPDVALSPDGADGRSRPPCCPTPLSAPMTGPSATSCALPSSRSRHASAPWSCCAITKTSPSARPPPVSGSRSAQ